MPWLILLSGGAGASGGRKPAYNADTAWWKHLTDAKITTATVEVPEQLLQQAGKDAVEVEVLQLAAGTTFPHARGARGKPLSEILYRKCYHTIFHKSIQAEATASKRALVIGTPGV